MSDVRVLEVNQYDEQGWVLGHWGLAVDIDRDVYPEVWAAFSSMMLHNMRRDLEAEGWELDLSRCVWLVRSYDNEGSPWPEQPVTLPLRS